MLTVRNLLAFAIVAFAAVLTFWVYRNYRGVTPQDEIAEMKPHVDLELGRFTFTETVDGDRRWTLTGERADHDFGDGTTVVDNVNMVFYSDDLGPITLTARVGEMNGDPPVVDLHGDVVIENPGRYKLYTDDLRYRGERRTVETAGPVRLLSSTMDIKAQGMRFYLPSRRFELLSRVEARMASSGSVL